LTPYPYLCVLRDAYCEKEFEKTKPICRRGKMPQSLIWKEIMAINRPAEPKKTKPIQSQSKPISGWFG
jgi:hypothetical protein